MATSRVIKAVIFDIDGTLCDSSQLGFSTTNLVLANNGFPLVTLQDYKHGAVWTTPVRMARHCGLDPVRDGAQFDSLAQ